MHSLVKYSTGKLLQLSKNRESFPLDCFVIYSIIITKCVQKEIPTILFIILFYVQTVQVLNLHGNFPYHSEINTVIIGGCILGMKQALYSVLPLSVCIIKYGNEKVW